MATVCVCVSVARGKMRHVTLRSCSYRLNAHVADKRAEAAALHWKDLNSTHTHTHTCTHPLKGRLWNSQSFLLFHSLLFLSFLHLIRCLHSCKHNKSFKQTLNSENDKQTKKHWFDQKACRATIHLWEITQSRKAKKGKRRWEEVCNLLVKNKKESK